HIDGDRLNNDLSNLKLTTPQEHYIDEHFEKRNTNGRFVANEPIFGEIKYRLFDRDKNITQIYTLQELISKTYRRAKFKFRGRFTGLKDKNGTEIYEGDVLQAFDREDFRMQIVYREPSFCIKWFDETIKSVRQTRDGTEPIPHNIHVTSRVIGNIYEHPHLLEE